MELDTEALGKELFKMGWTVISKGTIDLPKDTDQLLVQVYNKMKNYNHSSSII